MRLRLIVCVLVLANGCAAMAQTRPAAKLAPAKSANYRSQMAQTAVANQQDGPAAPEQLPVRSVVLYKSGVGFFQHLAHVLKESNATFIEHDAAHGQLFGGGRTVLLIRDRCLRHLRSVVGRLGRSEFGRWPRLRHRSTSIRKHKNAHDQTQTHSRLLTHCVADNSTVIRDKRSLRLHHSLMQFGGASKAAVAFRLTSIPVRG